MKEYETFLLYLVHETDDAFLIEDDVLESKNWIPKSQVRNFEYKRESSKVYPIFEFEISVWFAQKIGLI